MNRAAIIITASSRTKALERLLDSMCHAHYGSAKPDLIISIDPQAGHEAVKSLAESFEWPYGQKEIIRHPHALGLKKNMYFAMSKCVGRPLALILEDDLVVGKQYWRFARQAMARFGKDERIAQLGLYRYELNEFSGKRFYLLDEQEADGFFMQVPCSWGFAINERMWSDFQLWKGSMDKKGRPIPKPVETWSAQSWKQEFFKYLADSDRYVLFPARSQSSNFGESGVHFSSKMELFQSKLDQRTESENFSFLDLDHCINRFDAWFEVELGSLRRLIPELPTDCVIDLGGTKDLNGRSDQWVLSSRSSSKPEKSWDAELQPLWSNVVHDIQGDEIVLCKIESIGPVNKGIDLADTDTAWKLLHRPGHRRFSLKWFIQNWYVRLRLFLSR